VGRTGFEPVTSSVSGTVDTWLGGTGHGLACALAAGTTARCVPTGLRLARQWLSKWLTDILGESSAGSVQHTGERDKADMDQPAPRGPRLYDWALIEATDPAVAVGGGPTDCSSAAASRRRIRLLPCPCAAGRMPLAQLVQVACRRIAVEGRKRSPACQQSTGLDAGQVIRWTSWHP